MYLTVQEIFILSDYVEKWIRIMNSIRGTKERKILKMKQIQVKYGLYTTQSEEQIFFFSIKEPTFVAMYVDI